MHKLGGIAGTPSYIVNGIIHPNIRPEAVLDDWKVLIDPMLAHQLFDDIDNFPNDTNPVVCVPGFCVNCLIVCVCPVVCVPVSCANCLIVYAMWYVSLFIVLIV